jgi:hypothetical protein
MDEENLLQEYNFRFHILRKLYPDLDSLIPDTLPEMKVLYERITTEIYSKERKNRIESLRNICQNAREIVENSKDLKDRYLSFTNESFSSLLLKLETISEVDYAREFHSFVEREKEPCQYILQLLSGNSRAVKEVRQAHIHVLTEWEKRGYGSIEKILSDERLVLEMNMQILDLFLYILIRAIHSDIFLPDIHTIIPSPNVERFIKFQYDQTLPYTAEVPMDTDCCCI